MKWCNQCQQWKPKSGYYKNRSKPEGLSSECKECQKARQKAYKQTEAGKATEKRYYHSPKGQATTKQYAKSAKAKAYQREYNKSDARKENTRRYRQTRRGRRKHCKAAFNYRANHPERFRAQDMVNKEVRAGRMPRPDTLPCEWPGCEDQAEEYHHHSYKPKYWFDVQAFCVKHHNAIHGKI